MFKWFRRRKLARRDALYAVGLKLVKLHSKATRDALDAQDMGGGKKLVNYYLGEAAAYRKAVDLINDTLDAED